jgi:MerR family transcriptional regulator, light-induced transcriptional regulator
MSSQHGTAEGRHPIGVVAERTGLSLDVLRVWERRYDVVAPTRDASGRRLYTDDDIERLRLLSRAVGSGRSIGQVVGLTDAALRSLVLEDEGARWADARLPAAAADLDAFVMRGMEKAFALDGEGLEAVLRRAASVLGVPHFLEGVAAPLLRRIGEEWHAGRLRPSQEHVASAVVRSVVVDLCARCRRRGARPGWWSPRRRGSATRSVRCWWRPRLPWRVGG